MSQTIMNIVVVLFSEIRPDKVNLLRKILENLLYALKLLKRVAPWRV